MCQITDLVLGVPVSLMAELLLLTRVVVVAPIDLVGVLLHRFLVLLLNVVLVEMWGASIFLAFHIIVGLFVLVVMLSIFLLGLIVLPSIFVVDVLVFMVVFTLIVARDLVLELLFVVVGVHRAF